MNIANIMNQLSAKNSWVVIFLLAVVFLSYGNTLWNDYTLDDDMVVNEQTEQGFSAIPQIFSSKYIVRQKQASSYGYRPVVLSSFAVEAALVGKNAAFSHAINVALFSLLAIGVYFGGIYFFGVEHRLLALVASLLFAIHPLHTEVVASLKSRDELLAMLLSGLAVGGFARFVAGSWWGLLLGSCLFLLACLSKPTAIPLLFLLPFAFYWFKKTDIKQTFSIAGALLLPFVVVPLITKSIEQSQTNVLNKRLYSFFENPMQDLSFLERIPTGVYCIAKYLALHLVPHPLLSYYGYNQIPVLGWASVNFWIALAVAALLLAAMVLLRKQRIALFALLWWSINLLTYSNIFKVAPGIIAERLLFMGSLGFCILLAVGWERSQKMARYANWASLLLVFISIAFIAKTIDRNTAWKNDLSLFATDIAYQDASFKGNMLYAGTLAAQKQYPLAEQYYRRAIQILPQYNIAWNNLGYMYAQQNHYEDAWLAYKQAYRIDTNAVETNFNLADVAQKIGQKDTALYYYQKTIAIDAQSPQAQKAYLALSDWLLQKERYGAAQELLTTALKQQPNNIELLENLAQSYLLDQNMLSAIAIWEQMLPLLPQNKILLYKLQKANESMGNNEKAQYYGQKLQELGGMIQRQ
ncbi:MAG: tetratricopeptide repeat protein [Chitinophagales bacterium]|nr:tetratricopeptide repeat protein [Chitinophagales bacterium]